MPAKDLNQFMFQSHPKDVDLLRTLLQLNPMKRPSAQSVVRNFYFYEHPLPSSELEFAALLRLTKSID